MVLIYVTCKDQEEAIKLGKIVLEQKIAACINTWPIKSISRNGNEGLEEIDEVVLLIKTVEQRVRQVEETISINHSYKVPCIATIYADRINVEYKEWLTRLV
ncbi:MAG: divalent cation tolerance protein CutA [Patescibacteria group bacterium]